MPHLLENETANGFSASLLWTEDEGTYYVGGSFDGATVTLECTFDGSNWITIPNSAVTAESAQRITLQPCSIRALLTNAGGSTSITAGVAR